MTDFDAFYNYLSEQLYGEDYSKHDKSNLKNKLQPVFENEKILEIKDKRLSMIFLESFFMKFVSDNEKRELLRFYKDKCKELKNDNNDYDYINNLYQGKVQEFIEYKKQLDEKLNKELKLQICETKLYKKLEYENKQLLNIVSVVPDLNNTIEQLKQKNGQQCINHSEEITELKDVNENMREKLSKQLRTKITKELETEHKEELKLLKNKLKKTTQMYRKAQEELNEYKLEKELEES